MKILDKFKATLDKLFRRPQKGWFELDWGVPKDGQAHLRKLFPTLKGDFRKPDGTKHPQPIRYIRHRRRAGSPYRRKPATA